MLKSYYQWTYKTNKILIYIHKLLLIYNSYLTTDYTEVFEVLLTHKQELDYCHINDNVCNSTYFILVLPKHISLCPVR